MMLKISSPSLILPLSTIDTVRLAERRRHFVIWARESLLAPTSWPRPCISALAKSLSETILCRKLSMLDLFCFSSPPSLLPLSPPHLR